MKTNYFYIMGSASGVGKTTLCEGLLSQLLHDGYQPEQLAYIKPMTQCTARQAITDFCERKNITHQSIGSLVFKNSFTSDFIHGLTKNSAMLLDDILTEIAHISADKEIVIIDG
ncbi:MAG: AAA family ATPase, partial [Methylococcaceae bacterium]|nr:AAA family ATPase [Methylococcaceae bacterium]